MTRVWVYALCWNERERLPYFLRHYQSFAEKIVIYDHHSNDGSRAIIRASGAELRDINGDAQIDERVFTDIKNNCWKEAQGQGVDYCMIVDVDELIYAPDLVERLAKWRALGIPLLVPYGCDMVSETFPTTHGQIYEEVKLGRPSKLYSKPCILAPDLVKELNLWHGAHDCAPVMAGYPVYEFEMKCLHFKHIGRSEYIARRRALSERVSQFNKENKYWDLQDSEEEWRRGFDELLAGAYRVC